MLTPQPASPLHHQTPCMHMRFYYDIVKQPTARQPNPIATLECVLYDTFSHHFQHACVTGVTHPSQLTAEHMVEQKCCVPKRVWGSGDAPVCVWTCLVADEAPDGGRKEMWMARRRNCATRNMDDQFSSPPKSSLPDGSEVSGFHFSAPFWASFCSSSSFTSFPSQANVSPGERVTVAAMTKLLSGQGSPKQPMQVIDGGGHGASLVTLLRRWEEGAKVCAGQMLGTRPSIDALCSTRFSSFGAQLWIRDATQSCVDRGQRRAPNAPKRWVGPQPTLDDTRSVAPCRWR